MVVYTSTTAAYASESVLQTAGFQVRVIPVPRSISTDCCLGPCTRWAQREQVQEVLRSQGIAYLDMFLCPR